MTRDPSEGGTSSQPDGFSSKQTRPLLHRLGNWAHLSAVEHWQELLFPKSSKFKYVGLCLPVISMM